MRSGSTTSGASDVTYEAAGRTAVRIGSTLTAHTLYSGVPISGSPTSWVSQFTLACAKCNAIQTRPG